MAQSPEDNAPTTEIIRYDLGWNAINAMLRAGRSLSGHERNCCFLNTQGTRYADVSGAADLDLLDDGRVVALSDWDHDGDVDFWVANRSGPQVRYLQNNLRDQGLEKTNFIAIRLQGVNCNRDAIGARITIESEGMRPQTQSLRAGEGYLSQSSKWLHFGVAGVKEVTVKIRWPDGEEQSFDGVSANGLYRIRQGDDPQPWSLSTQLKKLAAQPYDAPSVGDKARIVLLNPIPVPNLEAKAADGSSIALAGDGQPRLINLWASWCKPCVEELEEWKNIVSDFGAAGLQVVALNVDEPTLQQDKVPGLLKKMNLPFEVAFGDEELAAQFDVLQRSLLSRQRPLPVPSSFLIDGKGRLRIVYKGPVSSEVLVKDLPLINAQPQQVLDSAVPFAGRWSMPPGGSTPLQLAVKLVEAGSGDIAADYIDSLDKRNSPDLSAELFNIRGAVLSDNREYQAASQAYMKALKLDPENRQANIELGTLLLGAGKGKAAEVHFVKVLRTNIRNPELIFKLALAQRFQGKQAMAKKNLRRALALREIPMARWNLADIAVGEGDAATAIKEYESAIKLQPVLQRRANNLAWLLATNETDELRNGARAVELAQVVCQSVEVPSSGQLDTLAAAFASVEMWERATTIAEDAVERAKLEKDDQSVDAISKRLELYRQKKPYRESL